MSRLAVTWRAHGPGPGTDELRCQSLGGDPAWNAVSLSSRLSALRRSVYEAAMAGGRGPVAVVPYALTAVGENPDVALVRVKAYADEMGWRVAEVIFEDCRVSNPTSRGGWRRALDAVSGGFAHGIVTVDRCAVSTSDRAYEQVLEWLHVRVAFLAHVPSPGVDQDAE